MSIDYPFDTITNEDTTHELEQRALSGEGDWVDDSTCVLSTEDMGDVRGIIDGEGSFTWEY